MFSFYSSQNWGRKQFIDLAKLTKPWIDKLKPVYVSLIQKFVYFSVYLKK